jgi:putative endonuclease
MIARLMFAYIDFAARKGLAESSSANAAQSSPQITEDKHRARRTGIRGETYAYWYLRRHGYTLVARNFTSPAVKGEIDLIGYDGPVLAFVEVKTRLVPKPGSPAAEIHSKPEDAVNHEKRRNLVRMARHFLRARRISDSAPYRFDILALETRSGARPVLRLHKGAFNLDSL